MALLKAIIMGDHLTNLGRPAQQDLDMLADRKMPIKAISDGF